MRRALLGLPLLFAGCLIESPSGDDTYYPPPDNSGWGSGPGGSGGTTDYGCHVDTDCGGTGLVCARDGECLSSSAVRIIHVNWTMNGLATSDTTCAHAPNLAITFGDTVGDQFGFAPVPCKAGRYTIDKFPSRYETVQLTREGEYSGGASTRFDAMGNATLDLKY